MALRTTQDRGQAFPIYVVMVAGLLFLAFAFFAVGQASAARNSAQGAADSVALGAAQEARDNLALAWLANVAVPTNWQIIFNGQLGLLGTECPAGVRYGYQNDADHAACGVEPGFRLAYTGDAWKGIGKSVIPGTEQKRSHAFAKAEVKPLCTILPNPDPTMPIPLLKCKWKIFDPGHNPTDLPTAKDLFDVYLVD
ncbi:pilus assembly protein TadG-related protein [Streptomyces sp. NPDC001941]|uniref:pilus assembly protein TadG-related protein n=1 Tax=Streptomyces sp. NPDC001941 TaxID=3154659 RepID=UPI003326F904